MPTVPWVRLYQNFHKHKKTMALRRAIRTVEPIQCLWLWAAENAPDGNLDGMTYDEIEDAADWHGKRGRAIMAMIEAGFIDVNPDGGGMSLHNWEERAGKGIASLMNGRERSRNIMRNKRANVNSNKRANSDDNTAKTLSLSLDLEQSGSRSSSLSASGPDQSNLRAKRPGGHDLVAMFGATRLKVFPNTLPWNTARDAHGDAGSFAALLSDDDIADLEPTMRLALDKIKAGAAGWTNPELSVNPTFAFGKWKSAFTGLREELHGRAPVVAKPESQVTGFRRPAQATYPEFEKEDPAVEAARRKSWAEAGAKAATS